MEILDFDAASLASDGRHVKLEVSTETGQQIIDINASLLESIIQQLGPVLEQARRARGGAVVVPPIEPDAYIAKATPDRQAISVAFRMPSGLNENFVFSVADAARLLTQIVEAVQTCKSST